MRLLIIGSGASCAILLRSCQQFPELVRSERPVYCVTLDRYIRFLKRVSMNSHPSLAERRQLKSWIILRSSVRWLKARMRRDAIRNYLSTFDSFGELWM